MPPIPLARALEDERRAIDRAGGQPGEYYALCLSGGGIRSASFALGIIQGLAQRGLLRGFDYVSTVSGGGFAGGWLSAWLAHASRTGDPSAVFEQLAGRDLPAGAAEPVPVTHMRQFSRYMSPQLGALSADSWTLVATMIRNIALNWLVLLPILAAVLLVPRAYLEAVQYFDRPLTTGAALVVASGPFWVLACSLLLIVIAVLFLVLNLPSYGGGQATQQTFLTNCLLPLIAGSLGLTLFWATDVVTPSLPWMLIASAIVSVATWMVPGVLAGPRRWRPVTWFAAAAASPVGGVGLWWLATDPFRDGVALGPFYATVALPALLAVWALQITLFIALTRHDQSEADLEWHSRLLGWILIAGTVWLAGAAVVFYAPIAFRSVCSSLEAHLQMAEGHGAGLVGAAGSLAGALLAQLARFAPSPSSSDATTPSSTGATLRGAAIALAAPLFAVFLLGGLASLDVVLMERLTAVPQLAWLRVTPQSPVWGDVTIAEVLAAAGILAALGAAMARFVPVNRFSLNGMYRERLIRAFLGASRRAGARHPNPFTGFDPADNVPMTALLSFARPFHVVNTTLNAVAESGLAMQFRKAEAFTISPLHCGSPRLDAFRPSAEYADEANLAAGAAPTGISLGTALSISGAAASPNMGARSSPALTFLMTLFNARLGVWLGNPGVSGDATWRMSEPALGPGPLIRELLGRTTDLNPYAYLSDGGHFENLGLWTMVLRRCRGILVSDAGADPDYTFDDLATAVRLIRTDLGVPIVFDHDLPIGPSIDAAARRHYAVGRILYSAIDGPDAPDGVLIYIKASLTGHEPVDVRSYATAHPSFPHESTAEQWFTEAQFESYRVLGLSAAASVIAGEDFHPTVPSFFRAVAAVPPRV